MPHGVANAEQLAMMARVVEAYCERFAVPDDQMERDVLAAEVLGLFNRGYRAEHDLMAEMVRRRCQSE